MSQIIRSYRYRINTSKSDKKYLISMFKMYRQLYNTTIYWHKERHMNFRDDNMYYRYYNYLLKQDDFRDLKEYPKELFKCAFDTLKKLADKKQVKTLKHDNDRRLTFYVNEKSGKATIKGKRIYIKYFRSLKLHFSRPLPEGCKVYKYIFSKTNDEEFYINIVVGFERESIKVETNKEIGLDMSLDNIIVTSEGEKIDYDHPLLMYLDRTANARRKLNRCEKDSKNYIKALRKLERLHKKEANIRKDFIEKLADKIAKENKLISIETLDIKEMASRHGKMVNDDALYTFKVKLIDKAKKYNHRIVEVGKYYPSTQLCSKCNYQNKKLRDVSLREWTCPHCGQVNDRDINAARNILKEGRRLLSQ